VKDTNCVRFGDLSRVAGRKTWSKLLGSYGVVEIAAVQLGGKFSSVLDVEAVVNHVLSTVVHDSTMKQLIVAQSLQWTNQCLSQ